MIARPSAWSPPSLSSSRDREGRRAQGLAALRGVETSRASAASVRSAADASCSTPASESSSASFTRIRTARLRRARRRRRRRTRPARLGLRVRSPHARRSRSTPAPGLRPGGARHALALRRGDGDGLALLVRAQHRRQHDDRREHGEREDVDTRNERSRVRCVISRRATSAIAAAGRSATTSRKRSASERRHRPEARTAPAARAASSSACGSPSGVRRTTSAVALAVVARHAGHVRQPAVASAVHLDRHTRRRGPAGAARRPSRSATSRPSVDDRHGVAEPLDELELVTGEHAPATPARARSSRTSAIRSTPTGSRPLNGSSSTRATGSCTSAAASWTRCWLPSDSASTRSPARPSTPTAPSSRSPPRARPCARRPCSWAK